MAADPTPVEVRGPVGADRARARGRALALIAELWARGLTGDTLSALRQVPGLPVALPDRIDADEAGAAHVRIAQTELFPYEGVFLHEGGLLGGDAAAALRDRRAGVGLGTPRELEPDHLAEELRLLAWLCGAEAEGLTDGADVAHVRAEQRAVLDQHLLRWLPAFVAAVQGLSLAGTEALYAWSAGMLLDLVLAWRAELPGTASTWSLPDLRPGLLDDERTGLARIARRLCTPALCGAFLSQAAIRRVGRRHDLPGGFGKRWQVLESVLAAGAHYESVPAVLDGLDAELAHAAALYDRVADTAPVAVAPWQARVGEGRALIAALREGVGAQVGVS